MAPPLCHGPAFVRRAQISRQQNGLCSTPCSPFTRLLPTHSPLSFFFIDDREGHGSATAPFHDMVVFAPVVIRVVVSMELMVSMEQLLSCNEVLLESLAIQTCLGLFSIDRGEGHDAAAAAFHELAVFASLACWRAWGPWSLWSKSFPPVRFSFESLGVDTCFGLFSLDYGEQERSTATQFHPLVAFNSSRDCLHRPMEWNDPHANAVFFSDLSVFTPAFGSPLSTTKNDTTRAAV